MRNTKPYRKISAPLLTFLALLLCGATTITAAPGDLDPTFGNGGKLIDGAGYGFDMALQSDGKIVVVGGHLADLVVARYNQDGSPDLTFGGGTGKVITDLGRQEYEWNIVIQPDGKIVAGGVSVRNGAASFLIVRYNSDGSFDTGFGGGTGKVLTALPCGDTDENYGADFTIQPDGKFVGAVKFEYCPGQLIRYISDGSLDVSFGNHGFVTLANGTSSLNSVLIQPNNGKVIWGFEFSGVYRYEPNGSPDLSFGSGGHVLCPFPVLTSVIIQPDGKIVAFGTDPNGYALVRYNINGSPDTSFGLNGLVTTPIGAGFVGLGSAAIQPDGKIVAAGSSIGINGTSDFTLVRFNGDGSLDGTFGGGDGITTVDFNNSSDGASDVALDSQGRAVVVGGSGGMFAIARFLVECSSANPIDCADFFIRQQYLDFLGREPDPLGAQWISMINGCAVEDPSCDRIHVSEAFFKSPEFQERGYFVWRFYPISFPNVAGVDPLGAGHKPEFEEFMPDLSSVSGFLTDAQLEAAKAQFAVSFTARQAFVARYGSLNNTDYVTTLCNTAGVALSNQQSLIDSLNNGSLTRAQVLRQIAESPEVYNKYYNEAFVVMQYFGYLRRDPDILYLDWIEVLDANPSDSRHMIHGFIDSIEYRHRFGP